MSYLIYRYLFVSLLFIGMSVILVQCKLFQSDQKAQQEEQKSSDSTVYVEVEQEPKFPGGKSALFEYLKSEIDYPDKSNRLGVEGTVIVNFFVNKDGSISNVHVAKSVSKLLDEEAKRVVKEMPPWKPGRQDGKVVRVRYRVPIRFSLE
jgi:protein TonB